MDVNGEAREGERDAGGGRRDAGGGRRDSGGGRREAGGGYDAIIIGAGINGLTAAAYLARAGRRVLVLEGRAKIGGSAATEEIAPGFRVDTCAHDAGWIAPVLIRELDLRRHGLEIVHPEPHAVSMLPDGGSLALFSDRSRTAASIAPFSQRDTERWVPFTDRIARLAGFLESLYAVPAPSVSPSGLGDFIALMGAGKRLRGLGRVEMIELLRTLPMSVAELLDDWFESEALKGLVGAGGITGIMQGARSGGTAFVLLHHAVGRAAGSLRSKDLVRGGTGNLALALAIAARSHGAQIRTDAQVEHIIASGGRATGVVLRSGEEISARRIISSADPRRTFLTLLGATNLEPEFVRAVQNIKYRGALAKVNLALGELPKFAAIKGDATLLGGAISIAPSLDYLERAYDDAKHGGVSRKPYLEARIPSVADNSLAPAGRHVMSVQVQYAPYHLGEGVWDDARREALGDLVVGALADYAPNLRSMVIARQILTARDLEAQYGLTEGNVGHGELTLDQTLFMRPVPGCSRYKTPVRDLYLCGAGTHPGGGISGMPGRLAAAVVLKEK
ncbi:MAG: phytoene desaturase family protein [Gemmatimonadaceae bacterium]